MLTSGSIWELSSQVKGYSAGKLLAIKTRESNSLELSPVTQNEEKKSVGKVGRDTVIPARAPLIVGKVTRSGSPFTTATMT